MSPMNASYFDLTSIVTRRLSQRWGLCHCIAEVVNYGLLSTSAKVLEGIAIPSTSEF